MEIVTILEEKDLRITKFNRLVIMYYSIPVSFQVSSLPSFERGRKTKTGTVKIWIYKYRQTFPLFRNAFKLN